MKKKIILAIMVTSMIMSNMTGVYASETQTLELGQTIDIVHEEGNFKVGIVKLHGHQIKNLLQQFRRQERLLQRV